MEEGPDISKTIWVDMFADADLATLLSELEPEDAKAFEAVSASLGARAGWSGSLEWLGLPWRWAIVYRARGVDEPALAYQIPDPRGSRVCVPVPGGGESTPEFSTLTKPVRTVLEQAAIVAGYLWPEWPSEDFDPVAVESLIAARDPKA